MDYRAVGELIWMAFAGLSLFGVVVAVSFQLVLRPFLEKLFLPRDGRDGRDPGTGRRLEALEGRVMELETEVESVRARQDFDRQLGNGE